MQMELSEFYDCDFFGSERPERTPCLFDEFNIDQYLDLSCLDLQIGSYATLEKTPTQQFILTSPSESIQEETPKTQPQKKNKSIFHNFQKHLITLLKKHITMDNTTFGDSELKDLALALFQAFRKSKLSNKRMLHIIFGLPATHELENELELLAAQSKEFRQIKHKKPTADIVRAQQMIRYEVINQAQHIDKTFLEAHSSVERLELFHEYFHSFVEELKEGPIAKRMTKRQKQGVINSIKRKEQQL